MGADELREKELQETHEQETLEEEEASTPKRQEEDERIRGILADLQEERRRRREAEERLKELEAMMEALNEMEEEETADEGKLDLDEADVLTVKDAKRLLGKEIEAVKKELLNIKQAYISEKLRLSEESVREKYSPDKVGEELSYDKVIEEGFRELVKENPAYREVVLNSPNPAEEAYRLGLTHPKFREILLRKESEKVIDQITKEKPKTGVKAGGGKGTNIDVSQLSLDELLKLPAEKLYELEKRGGE